MQLEKILAQLKTNTGKFPHLALKRAIEEQEAITPILLSTLERLSDNMEELLDKTDYLLHIYALYLLAQFRESLAYPLIIKFFVLAGEVSLDVTGDVVTEDLGRILASVSGGDIEPLKQLVKNQKVNEYVRSAALQAFLVLVAQEVVSREQVVQYYAELLSKMGEKEYDYTWTMLVINSTELGAVELKEKIDKAFEQDFVDRFFIDQEDVNASFRLGTEVAMNQLRDNYRYTFINDVISEIKGWGCFHAERF
ncbi:hypothetical protein A6769_29280 [Nostoc punctiforme NIES-2108]|uniref:DUF1186 domain-containing protein n=1 Tax=Nostoc punctiforme NIES-2108 TaxID=1356359 RepID=A0A367R674_NOSPU|nr:hypothetical protein A6769_29280 [Nostoc punctiforme NIES-2108]